MAEEEQDTQREYMTLDEAAQSVGLKRPSLYYYINALQIKRHHFKFNRHAYIARADVDRIREIKEKPWIMGEETTGDAA